MPQRIWTPPDLMGAQAPGYGTPTAPLSAAPPTMPQAPMQGMGDVCPLCGQPIPPQMAAMFQQMLGSLGGQGVPGGMPLGEVGYAPPMQPY